MHDEQQDHLPESNHGNEAGEGHRGCPILSLENACRRYPGVAALAGVSISIRRSEVHALLGKNGAGKSTLVKILSGVEDPDEGSIVLNGEEIRFANPAAARHHGVATVWQELSLVDGLSVAENITLGRWARRRLGRILPAIDLAVMRATAEEALGRLGRSLDVRAPVSHLSLADRQTVEIAKALASDPEVLILDEPTSSLSDHEAGSLLGVVKHLRKTGVAIVYVSHRMREVWQVADVVTILRDGHLTATMPVAEASLDRVTELMTGGAPLTSESRPSQFRGPRSMAPVHLKVSGLRDGRRLKDVNLEVRRGEVFGIAGLLGSGRTEILRSIVGLHPAATLELEIHGKPVHQRTPRILRSLGVGLMPEDRAKEGLVHSLNVAENLFMAAPGRVSRLGVLAMSKRKDLSEQMVTELGIAARGVTQQVGTLSGGNQQKVVLGKWLSAQSDVILMDEPDRGIDIHAKEQIHGLIKNMASRGLTVIVTSSELDELLAVADRIAILRDGRIARVVTAQTTTTAELLAEIMESE